MRSNYLWYQFFRYGVVSPALQMFYSNITVSGREYIPKEKPVIFVGNHQNALMDALHVVSNTRKFVHFISRAEPFSMPVLKHFFRSLNMMPVYRVRDGFSTIRKNAETFNQCYHRLGKGDAVLVFAEGNHDLRRRVRPLSKGFTRIAFGAEQYHNWQLDLQVQPVGLNYSRHRQSQSPVRIQFGPAIPVADFRQQYQDDERRAARALKDAAAEGLKNVTMHVSKLPHYPFYHLMLDELEPNRSALINPRQINQRVDVLAEHVTPSEGRESPSNY
ncbi:MAG: lysophospholipid acyltransferase family protein [Fodinibius sp.]|nr:lysophospholipid acyltransferase family protein [Fodinibius sp.]